ncbi:neutral zinc metallopeptidase [Aerococcaceae bacterium INB8]|uniref:Neutral zinc metallopeptidase n=1 Tax=Ruoffia halotolerans TaxID=2748684 RepID=A0A839A6D9_9LACT|nr:neutral zinc metallopeptidase [Ruoffia halotolerans]MBA5729328.1 neutral zinc metallopeptidase [Ruoffia halotolerans]
MKWEDLRRSKNVQDRRGQSGGLGRNRGGSRSSMGGGLLNLLFLIPGKGKWIVLAVILFSVLGGGSLGGFGDLLGGNNMNQPTNEIQVNNEAQQSETGVTDDEFNFVSSVLASTEDFWNESFSTENMTYDEPGMVIYEGGTATSGCGFGSSQAGPFYCPADANVYIDLSFWRDLSQQYGAPGDFAMAYVVAHEVGHHIQNEIGVMDEYNELRRRLSKTEANELNVRLELQADYFAGVWTKYAQEEGLLEAGDINEALQAAFAVGDDTIQERATGRVVPDSFTHGSAEQRQAWFMRGFEYGDFEHGDTFNTYLENE